MKYFKNKKLNRLKYINRGYFQLKKNNNINFIRKLKSELADLRIPLIVKSARPEIFGNTINNSELITRQFILENYTGYKLIREILFSIGNPHSSITYPMPKEWQEIFIKNGLKINQTKCNYLWNIIIIKKLIESILIFLYYLLFSILEILTKDKKISNVKFTYFNELSDANIPENNIDGMSYDILSWYLQWEGRDKEIQVLGHNIKNVGEINLKDKIIKRIGKPVQSVSSLTNLLKLILWFSKVFFISLKELLFGHWCNVILLGESIKAKIIELSEPHELASEYMFHFSANIYRPMWTYEAELKGSRIICYFYSTFEQHKLSNGYVSQRYELGLASWPICLVWDSYQAELIKREFEPSVETQIVGPIWFSGSKGELQDFPSLSIAVFDTQAHRKSSHFGFSTLAEFYAYNSDLDISFLKDIFEVLSEKKITLVLKRKREIGNRAIKKYKKFLREISESEFVKVIDPGISAIRIINKCDGIISFPFTSTSLLNQNNKPNIYYDPTGWIQKDDRAAHGVTIIQGKAKLKEWVSNNYL